MWRPVVPLLAREREVIAVDMPGFGASPPGPQTLGGLADAVAAFAASLGIDRPHVAGNSLGGGVALALGAAGRARSVCAISPVGFAAAPRASPSGAPSSRSRACSRRPLRCSPARAPRARCPACYVAAPPVADPARGRAALGPRGRGRAVVWALLRADWKIEAPACATTIAWGERDRLLIFSRQFPRAQRRLPSARHVVLRGCGHVPTWDDPEQVAHVLLEASAVGPAQDPEP